MRVLVIIDISTNIWRGSGCFQTNERNPIVVSFYDVIRKWFRHPAIYMLLNF